MKKPVRFRLMVFGIWIANICNPVLPHNPAEAHLTALADSTITSGNPIIRHIRSADPAAEVWNDGQVWIYASHDQDNATDYSTMDGYHVFSSPDLVNWTDHGEILHSRDVTWGNPDGGWMFAPDAAYKNGMYYFYFPTLSDEWMWRIGVATSETPEGPFTDIGHYIDGTDNFDPTCFVDDDGQAYLLWGGGSEEPKIARLKENMTELAEEPRIIDYGADNFGEGGYLHRREGIYYFSYTCNTCWPYQGYYAMGDNPYGPYEYRGELNPAPPGAQDHHSIIEFHNQWYYFYHVGNFEGGSINRRNICIDSLHYNPDGTMQIVEQTGAGVRMDLIGGTPGKIVPGRIEAEEWFRQSGTVSMHPDDSTTVVSQIRQGDWLEYVIRVLGTDTFMTTLKVAAPFEGTTIYAFVDDVLTDSVELGPDSSMDSIPVLIYEGKHTLKLLFSNDDTTENLLDMDWIELQGERIYYAVEATASAGGTITPGGITYYEKGETGSFAMEAEDNFVLDSIQVDGIYQDTMATVIFPEIAGNHTIRAWFSECLELQSVPYFQVNDQALVNGTEISMTEGDDLHLLVSFIDSGSVAWAGPGGLTGSGKELFVDSIRVFQEGKYMAVITYGEGCESTQSFDVDVDYINLDVYEAEAFYAQSGIRLDPCKDFGGGSYVGYIEDGDWCSYAIGIEEAGIYELIARVSAEGEGGIIEVTEKDSLIAIVAVSGPDSGSGENWYSTEPVEVAFNEGIHRLKFSFVGNAGPLFNFNWFDLVFLHSTGQEISKHPVIGLETYPNPAKTETTVSYTLDKTTPVDVIVYNSSGVLVRKLVAAQRSGPGTYTVRWDATDDSNRKVSGGLYFIKLINGEAVFIRKVIIL